MHYVLLFIVIFFQLVAQNGYASDCRNSEETLKRLNQNIQSYRTKDVSKDILEAQNLIASCVNLSSQGLRGGSYNSTLVNTRMAEFERRRKQIELYSKYGDTQTLVADTKSYAKQVGLWTPALDRQLNTYVAVGREAVKTEQKSCTSVDMRKDLGPPRSQDSTGWCVSFSVADMVSYKLKKRVSAADVAISYYKNDAWDILRQIGITEDQFAGGLTTGAFRAAKNNGFCLEKDFPSEDNSGAGYANRLNEVDNLGRKIIRENGNCDEFVKKAAQMFPNATTKDMRDILEHSYRDEYFKKLVDKTCKKRIDGKNLDMNFFIKTTQSSFGKKIDELLSTDKPVEISYSGALLSNDQTRLGTSDHSSLLVGRRFNPQSGQCEYLLRNSWGTSCGYYDSNYSCEKGNVWIPKAKIIEGASSGAFIN